jgi:hypothetical protein
VETGVHFPRCPRSVRGSPKPPSAPSTRSSRWSASWCLPMNQGSTWRRCCATARAISPSPLP